MFYKCHVPFGFLLIASSYTAPIQVVKSVSIQGVKLDVNLATQVGRPYDAQAVEKDVRHLWTLGRFHDIRAEVAEDPDGASVVFDVVPEPQMRLHEIRLEPNSFGLQPKIPEGSMIDEREAHRVAEEARRELQVRGFLDPQVAVDFRHVDGTHVVQGRVEQVPGLVFHLVQPDTAEDVAYDHPVGDELPLARDEDPSLPASEHVL
jgi:outer membrane protein assembly factor BamA